jgi:tetratricopeptide (TPR) repeat protein
VANRAQSIYANGVEPREPAQVKHFEEVMARAVAQAAKEPKNANAHYQYAYSAGRYSQRISIAKALAQGYGGKIRSALEAALKIEPKHADAHIALGAFHAEIIDKIGGMVGRLTYGASKEAAEEHYKKALKLTPDSPIAHIEYANGLMMLHGKKAIGEASALYEKASKMKPKDAMEKLDIDQSRAELE